MNNYGVPIESFSNNFTLITQLLSACLNRGKLGLILGSGASKAINLPVWYELLERCRLERTPDAQQVDKTLSTDELKRIASSIKSTFQSDEDYLNLVREKLYEGVDLNFKFAKKDLLIALTSLFVGKMRGNISKVVTLNFDSVLEWYLQIQGLSVGVTKKNHLELGTLDVEVFHLHGYLPYSPAQGEMSDDIIFTQEEFEDRMVDESYWKELMDDFYRKQVFLAVGLSESSLVRDLLPYIRKLTKSWYGKERINRNQPYGVAFLSECSEPNRETLIANGIIPCVIADHLQIPEKIFNISQLALEMLKSR